MTFNAAPKDVTNSTITSIERDGDTYLLDFAGNNGNISVVTNMEKNGDKLILTKTHIEGSGAGSSSLSELRDIARTLGEKYGVDEVIIQGGIRRSGANIGKVPRPIVIKVN